MNIDELQAKFKYGSRWHDGNSGEPIAVDSYHIAALDGTLWIVDPTGHYYDPAELTPIPDTPTGRECPRCHGARGGNVRQADDVWEWEPCPDCRGEGYIPDTPTVADCWGVLVHGKFAVRFSEHSARSDAGEGWHPLARIIDGVVCKEDGTPFNKDEWPSSACILRLEGKRLEGIIERATALMLDRFDDHDPSTVAVLDVLGEVES